MKTTVNKIKALQPCKSGLVNLIKQLGTDFDHDSEFEVSSLVGGENHISDITWLLGKTGEKRKLVEFSVYCAELVLPIYEKDNDSKAPRNAIELTKKWLIDDKSVTRQELRDAADYAAYAAADADAAADAATAHAAYADAYAYAAANVAHAAAYADTAAANAANAANANAAANAAADVAAATSTDYAADYAAAAYAADYVAAGFKSEIENKLKELINNV